jgi:hypothetical protein
MEPGQGFALGLLVGVGVDLQGDGQAAMAEDAARPVSLLRTRRPRTAGRSDCRRHHVSISPAAWQNSAR